MQEEEDAKPKPRRLQELPLHALGIGEMQDYIAELRAEITRVEADIARKQSHRTAADAFFKRG